MSIRQLRARLSNDESGMGIVEIIVALMVFSIVASACRYSMLSMTRLTGDASARETATNLAAAEIDRVQAIPDAFSIHEDDRPEADHRRRHHLQRRDQHLAGSAPTAAPATAVSAPPARSCCTSASASP